MKKKKYFYHLENNFYGPLSLQDIEVLYLRKKIYLSQYVYDEDLKCLFIVGDLKAMHKYHNTAPSADFLKNNYLVLKNDQSLAFYTKQQINENIKKGMLEIFDYVYLNEQDCWKKIKDVDSLYNLIENAPVSSPVYKPDADFSNTFFVDEKEKKEMQHFFIRQFPRTPFSAHVTLENNGKMYIGNCSTIGEGGAFLELSHFFDFSIGQKVIAKFVSGIVPIRFELSVEIRSIMSDFPKGLGIKFIDLHVDTKYEIKNYVYKYLDRLEEVKTI